MSANKILIADDDKVVHESLGIYLKSEGFEVVDVYDGKAAVAALDSEIALCVLDIMMPEMSGLDVCREIRKTSRVPVIMLTAKGEEIDRILGLELGADDYITKPYTLQVLLARIKSVLRRNNRNLNKARRVKSGNLVIDFDQCVVLLEGKELSVTPTQFHILKLLIRNHGVTLTREQITSILWTHNDEYIEDNTLRVHISNLKSKIGNFNGQPYLETIRGVGYQWRVNVVLCTD